MNNFSNLNNVEDAILKEEATNFLNKKNNFLNLDKNLKIYLNDVSNISGIALNNIQTIYEYSFVYSIIQMLNLQEGDKFKEIFIPFYGKIVIKKLKDDEPINEDSGSIYLNNYQLFFIPSNNLVKALENLQDENYAFIEDFLDKKILERITSIKLSD